MRVAHLLLLWLLLLQRVHIEAVWLHRLRLLLLQILSMHHRIVHGLLRWLLLHVEARMIVHRLLRVEHRLLLLLLSSLLLLLQLLMMQLLLCQFCSEYAVLLLESSQLLQSVRVYLRERHRAAGGLSPIRTAIHRCHLLRSLLLHACDGLRLHRARMLPVVARLLVAAAAAAAFSASNSFDFECVLSRGAFSTLSVRA